MYVSIDRATTTSIWLHIHTQLWLTFPLSRRRWGKSGCRA